MLSIGLLGGLNVRIDGKHTKADFGHAGRRLAAYLTQYLSRAHRRERLADMFWADIEPARARAALNTALWRLRKTLAKEARSKGGKNLVTLGDEVVLEGADWLSVDTHIFDLCAKSAMIEVSSTSRISPLEQLAAAVDGYTGPFLDGDDDDWILAERERLHSLYVRVSNKLAKCLTAKGRYEEAVQVLRGVLASDPFREAAHRDRLVLLVLDGRRAEALRTHEKWCGLMRRELGIRPMPQTGELAALIQSDGISSHLDSLREAYLADMNGERV